MMNQFKQVLYPLHGEPATTGMIKARTDDFLVQEELGFDPDGEGEHVLVRVRKRDCNTPFVAQELAKFAGLPAREVSYAGLKDRRAVTEQWFCLHLPGKETPDFSAFQLAGCEILQTARHRRKLRIGTLKGNKFILVLREISDRTAAEQRLQDIRRDGVPNYFGSQRFGQQGNNIVQALKWSRGEITIKERAKRSFYLSAARSALFNSVVSERLSQYGRWHLMDGDALQLTGRGSWFVAADDELPALSARLRQGELSITAPLPGMGEPGTMREAQSFEQRCLQLQPDLLALLQRERLETARRAMLVTPADMVWLWHDDAALTLSFALPAGCFATSVVRELLASAPDSD